MKVQTLVRSFPSKTVLTVFLLLVVLIRVLAGGAEEEDWPCWRGPNGDGVSRETDWNPEALSAGARVLWTTDIGRGYSNIAIKNDLLFTMGSLEGIDHVLCLNAETGEEIWRHSLEMFSFFGPQATPGIGRYQRLRIGHGRHLAVSQSQERKGAMEQAFGR